MLPQVTAGFDNSLAELAGHLALFQAVESVLLGLAALEHPATDGALEALVRAAGAVHLQEMRWQLSLAA